MKSRPSRLRETVVARTLCAATATAFVATSCSIKQLAIDGLSDTLALSADSMAMDEDPELVREALPFLLKMNETLLLESPENETLLLSASSGFTKYAYAFIAADATEMEEIDYDAALVLEDRVLKLYLRARDYALYALELRHPGITAELPRDPDLAASRLTLDDVPFAYWTASSWGLAISTGLDRPELAADVDVVRAVLRRCLELEPNYDGGSLHQAMIVIESFPEVMGGSPVRAREHFEAAVALSGGRTASPYVSFAESVSVPSQERAEFEELLQAALEIDLDQAPEARLANDLAQVRARQLLDMADDLFLEPLD